MRVLVVMFLCAVCSLSQAADRSEKIRELMELQGLVKMFDQQLQSGREHARSMADQMLDKMLTSLNPPEEFKGKLKQAAEEFVEAAQTPWTAQEVVDAWSKYYGAKFSDNELDQLLKYYRSSVGQKDVTVSHEALVLLQAEFRERYTPVMDQATQQFIKRIQTITEECNCKK
jgi:hypothetical protein